ncbi:MAG: hypothetical protein OEL89_01850, partial [Candidatus Peregrinibacteria bacterium]|nr:hypothetical protein [Candidatus Peregrinibacteria bacterium]
MRVNKFFVFMIGLFCIGFALAAVLVNGGGTAFSSVNESIVAVYNFSVNNTQATENISEVNVTLPGGFVFVSDTNATDVAVTAFSNTTSVLSWTNTSLILNGSLQYFWFNATSSSMAGDYNIIITVSNSTGVFETQNLSVTVNDTTAPIVTINSPSAITYTTASITLNTTINENGTCWYSFDAGTTNVSMTNVDNRTFIAALTKANASYVVNYYCNDSVGNLNSSENVSFTVAVAPTVTSSSSASASTRTYAPSASQMLEGYNVFLHKGDRTRFSIDDEIHYFKVNSISGNLVKITISSDPISLDMTVGDSEKVDLNSDGYYDLKVNLQSVSDTRSNFVLTTINEL